MAIQASFFFLIEKPIHEAVHAAGFFSAVNAMLEPLIIKLVHLVAHILCAGTPVAEELLWDPLEKWENIDGWCVSGFHDF